VRYLQGEVGSNPTDPISQYTYPTERLGFLKSLTPSTSQTRFFDDDIYAVDVSSLGKGSGFEVVGRYSVLDDAEITGLIADRCLRILDLIEGEGKLPTG